MQIAIQLSTKMKSFSSVNSNITANNAAVTERSVRRLWEKCMEAEEANRMLKKVVEEGVWTNCVEAYSRSKAGRERWVNRGEEGRVQVARDEMKSRVLDSDYKVRGLKRDRKLKTNIFKQSISHNIFRRKLSKILEFCQSGRESARAKVNEKVMRLKLKYGEVKDDFDVPVEIKEFSKCEMFQKNVKMKPDEPSGPVIVCDEGEELSLSSEEWKVLARGPTYCVVRG